MIPVSKKEQSISELLDAYGDDINIHILYIYLYMRYITYIIITIINPQIQVQHS